MADLADIKKTLKQAIGNLYEVDAVLFERNYGRALCERCLVFRLGLHLQTVYPEYFVDADYDSSSRDGQAYAGKRIRNRDGTFTNRFIDLIVHRRKLSQPTDFICFEIKKWNGRTREGTRKDRNNLDDLTSRYGYQYGFYLILGRTIKSTYCDIYQNGQVIERNVRPASW